MEKILIIEDSLMMQKVIRHIATSELDCEFDIAGDLAEAKALIAKNKYFLALADLHLPDAPNGEIVNHLADANIAIIVLTASMDEKKRDLVLKQGVIDYIIKENRDSYFHAVKLANQLLHNKDMIVLLADDSKVLRAHICWHLEKMLFKVIEVDDGVEALKVFEQNPDIELLITDFIMPNMNGIELIRNIRKQRTRDTFPIIGLSSSADPTLSAQFIKHGANDFLATPFIHEEFQWRVLQTIEQVQLIKKITDIANRDYLTKLFNRRYFFKTANQIYKAVINDNSALTLCLIDIDFFKSINDNYGHDNGDAVLVQIAELFMKYFSNNIVARYGGEEFIVAIHGVDENECRQILERFRLKVQEHKFSTIKGALSITVSLGAVMYQNETLEQLIRKADVALFTAKEAGRNKLVF